MLVLKWDSTFYSHCLSRKMSFRIPWQWELVLVAPYRYYVCSFLICRFTCWVQQKPFPQIRHLYFSSLVWHRWCNFKFFSTFMLKLLQIVQTYTFPVWVFACDARSLFHLKSLPHPFFAQIEVLKVLCTILWVASSLSNAKLSSHL